MTVTEIIIIVLCLVSVVLGAAAVVTVSSLKKNDAKEELAVISERLSALSKSISDEFERNRRESGENSLKQREEMTKALETMSEKIEKMNKVNLESKIDLMETVNKSLNEIRDKNAEQSREQTKAIETSISKMQESNEKKLDEMRSTVDEKLTSTLTKRLDSSFKTVSEQLENLYKSLGEMRELSNGVTTNVTSLNRILTNVKARGTWAEVQLEGILDQTIPNMYEKNIATGDKETERVEFAIKIPAGENSKDIIYMPVDSKFPAEDYIRLCDAADNADAEGVRRARKALEDRVISEAKQITKYISVPKTTPFAIMYLATEGLYAEIASSRTGLPERLQKDYNIMIAGPTTITALLNSLSMGFKTVAINEKANEVRVLLGATKAQYETFTGILEKAKKKIDEAGKTLEDAQHRNSIIKKKLKSVEDIDNSESENILGIADGQNGIDE